MISLKFKTEPSCEESENDEDDDGAAVAVHRCAHRPSYNIWSLVVGTFGKWQLVQKQFAINAAAAAAAAAVAGFHAEEQQAIVVVSSTALS
jgi:hypothetical protein